jgi:prepilin-type N-terminal cleavage/methylation domain-containing protein/prepilin-type processing-associated H-X9-DG protein
MKPIGSDTAKRAMTMLELMAAVAVVGILAALLLPFATGIPKKAKGVQCTQNLRTIFLGMRAYMEDNKEFIPPPHPSTGANMTEIYEGYDYNQYWWMQAYLAPYVTKTRERWAAGKLTQKEAEIFNCPLRTAPDAFWHAHSDPAVSYVMAHPSRYSHNYLTMENKSRKLLVTEGRHSTVTALNARTLDNDNTADAQRRLRRFHGNGLNVLYWDGHIEMFTGPDEDLAAAMP